MSCLIKLNLDSYPLIIPPSLDILTRFIKLHLAEALSNNTKFYFSGQQSELGSLFNKILGNG